MKIEKWKYQGREVDVRILEEDEIEKNEYFDDLEDTLDLTEQLENIEDYNAN